MGLIGGAIKKGVKEISPGYNFFTMLIIGLLVIFIKAYIVQVSYNNVVEKVTGNTYKLTYVDAIFLVILLMGLL
mgnify:CR=1 FL=1|tara:strand:+ start:53 stop:274 length:222 start_codon:yes stop_codon:yes gene_type:complete